jgi:hypothetical protein
VATAENAITAQVNQGPSFVNPLGESYYYLDDTSLVKAIAADVAALTGSQSNYDFGPTGGITPGYIDSKFLAQNLNNPEYVGDVNQCVAVVQGLDQTVGGTASWNLNIGNHLQVDLNGMGNMSILPGTPIATFGANGLYNGQHAGIFLGYGTEGSVQGFFMLDQYYQQSDQTPTNQPAEIRFHPFVTADHSSPEYFTILPT